MITNNNNYIGIEWITDTNIVMLRQVGVPGPVYVIGPVILLPVVPSSKINRGMRPDCVTSSNV